MKLNGPHFVIKVIGRLEKRFGTMIDYYQPLVRGTNLATGAQTCSYASLTIKRALLLPIEITRGFNFDTAFLAAGNGDAKNFSFGALHDTAASSIVLRAKEFKTLVPKMEDHISWRALRFDVKDVKPYPDIGVYVIHVLQTKSSKNYYFKSGHSIAITSEGGV